MKRDYAKGSLDSPSFFFGKEVEKTPVYGEETLFVVGLQNVDEILHVARNSEQGQRRGVTHIYLGANKSFNQDGDWAVLVDRLLHEGYWVTLDYPIRCHAFVMRMLNQEMRHSKFIPMISVEVPDIEAYNYNTVLKIDDVDMDYSNPGVWCHSLHDLMNRKFYTPWEAYKEDEQLDKTYN